MNQHIYQRRPVNSDTIPTVIFFLIISNGLIFAAQHLPQFKGILLYYFALWPVQSVYENFYPWQLVTYGFLHDTAFQMHIIFNMLMLWMFGRELELLLGARRFLTYYMTCVIGAGIVQLIVTYITGSSQPTIGASGGVFGLLLAFGMAFPNRMILLIIPPIPMKAKYMVVLMGVIELTIGISGAENRIANFAHLGGMLFGFLLIQHWKKGRRT